MAVNAYYAGGKVAVLSTKLWSKDRFFHLAESANLSVAVKSLQESGYGGGVTIASPNDYEEILQSELTQSVAFLRENTSNTKVSDCFLLSYDYINAKVMMKSKYMRIEPTNLYKCGTLESDKMWEAISVDDYKTLPEPMQWALNKIDEEFVNGNRKPSVIDNYLDRALFKDISLRTKFCPLESVRKYFKANSDVANVLCYFRLKRAGLPFSADNFVEGGTYKPEQFAKLVENGENALVDAFCETPLEDVVRKATNGEYSQATKLANEVKRQALISGKDNFTVEPVICYFLSKLTEIDNIRTVLICVKNKVDKQTVKEKVKELYV